MEWGELPRFPGDLEDSLVYQKVVLPSISESPREHRNNDSPNQGQVTAQLESPVSLESPLYGEAYLKRRMDKDYLAWYEASYEACTSDEKKVPEKMDPGFPWDDDERHHYQELKDKFYKGKSERKVQAIRATFWPESEGIKVPPGESKAQFIARCRLEPGRQALKAYRRNPEWDGEIRVDHARAWIDGVNCDSDEEELETQSFCQNHNSEQRRESPALSKIKIDLTKRFGPSKQEKAKAVTQDSLLGSQLPGSPTLLPDVLAQTKRDAELLRTPYRSSDKALARLQAHYDYRRALFQQEKAEEKNSKK